MLTIEEIKEIVKKELGLNLEDTGNCYMSKNNVVYVSLDGYSKAKWIIALEKETKSRLTLELTNYKIVTAKELKSLIRKFKKLRKMI